MCIRDRHNDSEKSKRIMKRGGKPYYLYKDTVMSKLSPFRPELITELEVVANDSPKNSKVRFNNGHFLHQFTYFIGPVNFYYIEKNKKKVAKMNTGDSMYISPYVCHSFTTRKNKKKLLGKILALTYSDKLDNETLNEITALGFNITKKFKINLKDHKTAFWSNIENFFKNSSITFKEFKRNTSIDLDKIKKSKKIPSEKTIKKISHNLKLNYRDLFPPNNTLEVKIQKYSSCKNWFYPSMKKKDYLFKELTNIPQLPFSRGYELTLLNEKKHKSFLDVPSHQSVSYTHLTLPTKRIV